MFWKFQLSFPSPAMTVQIAVFCGFALMRAAALTRLMPLSIPDCVRLPAAIDVISSSKSMPSHWPAVRAVESASIVTRPHVGGDVCGTPGLPCEFPKLLSSPPSTNITRSAPGITGLGTLSPRGRVYGVPAPLIGDHWYAGGGVVAGVSAPVVAQNELVRSPR